MTERTWKRIDLLLVLLTIIILTGSVWIWILAMPVAREVVFLAATIALVVALVLVVNVAVLVLLRLQQRVSHLESLIAGEQPRKEEEEPPEILVITLTNIERRVLNRLEENGGTMTQDELRRATGLSKSTLSVTLNGLERKTIITRETLGRTKLIHLERSIPK